MLDATDPTTTSDRWVVVGKPLFDALRLEWRPVTDSLLFALRLECEAVAWAPDASKARSQIDKLLEETKAVVRVVFHRLDTDERRTWSPFLPKHAARVHLYDFTAEPQDVLVTLCTPEPALAEAWRKGKPLDAVLPESFLAGREQQWHAALQQWERALESWPFDEVTKLAPVAPAVVQQRERAPEPSLPEAMTDLARAAVSQGWFVTIAQVWHWVGDAGRALRLGTADVPKLVGDWHLLRGAALGTPLSHDRAVPKAMRDEAPGGERQALHLSCSPEHNATWELGVSITPDLRATLHEELWRFDFTVGGNVPAGLGIELRVGADGPGAGMEGLGVYSPDLDSRASFVEPMRTGRWEVRLTWRRADGSRAERTIELPLRADGV